MRIRELTVLECRELLERSDAQLHPQAVRMKMAAAMTPAALHARTRSYRQLDAVPVCATISRLALRIEERFPVSGLSGVAAELERLAVDNERMVNRLQRPNWWLRLLTGLAIAALTGMAGWTAWQLTSIGAPGSDGLSDVLQGGDAAVNELVLLALAILFSSPSRTA